MLDKKTKNYIQGNCDIMALALNRLTGLEFGIFAGKYDDDGEDAYEFCHAVVIKNFNNMEYIDVLGIQKGIPDNLYFNSEVTEIVLLQVGEEDIRGAFTMQDISESQIQEAMEFILFNQADMFKKMEHRGSSLNIKM